MCSHSTHNTSSRSAPTGFSSRRPMAAKTWVRRKIIDEDFHLNRLTRGPTGTLYLAGEHGTLLRSADNGATAGPAPRRALRRIVLRHSSARPAHAPRVRLARPALPIPATTVRRGRLVPLHDRQPLLLATALQLLKSNFIVVAGQARALLLSRDYGRTFSPWDAPLTTAVAKLIELPDGDVLALGEAGATVLPKP